jgi:hypothetical protein
MPYLLDPAWIAAFSLLLLPVGAAYVLMKAEPPV